VTLRLRIPGWAESATLRVNGEAVDSDLTPGKFVELRRGWTPGDVVELDLPMRATVLEANPLVEETRNQVAVKRGPVVYCLESPDLPDGVRVENVAVTRDAEFTPQFDGAVLDGVTVLEAPLVARDGAPWERRLYRPRQVEAEQEIRARLIPYYAWSNRGESEMSVWLPSE
jgi:DUF1680 family protein